MYNENLPNWSLTIRYGLVSYSGSPVLRGLLQGIQPVFLKTAGKTEKASRR